MFVGAAPKKRAPMLPTKREKSGKERAAVLALSLCLSTLGVVTFVLTAHEDDKELEWGKTIATVVLLAFFIYSKFDKQEMNSTVDNFFKNLKL